MKTEHRIIFGNARDMSSVRSTSVDLVVTSPPYPMIQMWDDMFCVQNPEIRNALKNENGGLAFELMNNELDRVWKEVYRVLKVGGIACINIGDATRSISGRFQIYTNHARILSYGLSLGFHALPEILWIKETNKPDKFMGSGMLPVGAYVTLEHEHILVLRKGDKREFKSEEQRENRQKSAFFWEERNLWFSDKWRDINGVFQKLNHTKIRERSGAYPTELVYRLINMFSVQGDVVLDPFLGTGTTTLGAMAAGRNSVGFEVDLGFESVITKRIGELREIANEYTSLRLDKHLQFIEKMQKENKEIKYTNKNYGFPVVTKQEINLHLPKIKEITKKEEKLFQVDHLF